MQDSFLRKVTKENRDRIIPNQIKVIDFCSKNKVPLIVLKYKRRGDTTKILKERIQKLSNVQTVIKENNSGFMETNLDEILEKMKVKNIVLMGINASGCVQDTAIGALHRGYKILTASTVIASFSERDRNLATSEKWYPRKGKYFRSTEDLLKYLTKL
jgi:nicotinamidase-related amidase